MPSGETQVEHTKSYSEELQHIVEDAASSNAGNGLLATETLFRKSPTAKIDHIGIYKLGKTLGKGSFCKVKLATHAISGQQFAVKIMKVFETNTKKWYEIEREIEALRKLNHPNIIKMYQVLYTDEDDIRAQSPTGTEAPTPACVLYMIMELAEGGELFDYIIKHEKLHEEEARRLFRQMVSALEYMHAHLVVHRDLKPENIVMDAHNNIKINDFGLSNFVNPGMRMSTFCGSPVYAAPEILRKKNYDGPSVDIWSLGVILFTMVTAHLPWKPSANSIQNVHDMLQGKFVVPHGIRLSSDCVDVLRKMLCPDPKKRITANQLRTHPWVNEGYIDPPCSYLEPFPPVTEIDNGVIKQMTQMNYSSRQVQEVVLRNETGPILTTYHTLKCNKINHDGSLVRAFPSRKQSTSSNPPPSYASPWLQSFALKTTDGADRIHSDMTESHKRKTSLGAYCCHSSRDNYVHSSSMPAFFSQPYKNPNRPSSPVSITSSNSEESVRRRANSVPVDHQHIPLDDESPPTSPHSARSEPDAATSTDSKKKDKESRTRTPSPTLLTKPAGVFTKFFTRFKAPTAKA